ncbi:uncharacterized protein [Musca autumnalis]|uniref:uncharacterized protein n=1 Tax=Musca autumnalis TaxID=221902 RepID=UPI003CF4D414
MSYQIKSTPYLQRIVSASKKDGQLQRLKEEYERIKDFDEKAIEKKMRQVRLKRLFKEIQDLKVTNLKKKKHPVEQDKIKSNGLNDSRLENLAKAKKIGQYYSQRNGGYNDEEPNSSTESMDPSFALKIGLLSKKQIQERERQKEERMREQVNRRKNYGNQISNWNMHKMLQGKLRNEVSEGMKQTFCAVVKGNRPFSRESSHMTSETTLDGKERLKTRIDYGNFLSQRNRLGQSKRNWKHQRMSLANYEEQKSNAANSVVIDSSRDILYESAIDIPNVDADNWERRVKARRSWQKLAQLILFQKPLTACCENKNEFTLHSVSNGTNIRKNEFILQSAHSIEISDKDESKEILLNKQNLCYNNLSLPSAPLSMATPPQLHIKPILKGPSSSLTSKQQVDNFIQSYAPYSMDVVKREIIDMSVQKLRDIFEHQNS